MSEKQIKRTIKITTKSDLAFSVLLKEIGKKLDKTRKKNPELKIDLDYDFVDENKNNIISLSIEGEESKVKKEVKLGLLDRIAARTAKKFVNIEVI